MNQRLIVVTASFAIALLLWLTYHRHSDAQMDGLPDSGGVMTVPKESHSDLSEGSSAAPAREGLQPKAGIRDAVAQTVAFSEAVEAGVFKLSADELWAAVKNHPDREVRSIACPLIACTALAAQRSVEKNNPMRFGEGRELLDFVRTPERLGYLQWSCGRLVESEPQLRERDHPLSALHNNECGELNDRANELVGDFLECMNGLCFRALPDPDGQLAERIESGLRSSTNLWELHSYTEAALIRGDIIEGTRAAEQRFRTSSRSNQDFVRLLSAKWMCRLEGACGGMSPIVLELCAGVFQCRPGDDLISVAERNLSPLDFEDWMQARLPRQNGGG